ncbi:AEC family transporter [Ornithinimicrobium cavernae]|uniref:AEC family transporter n=1 Tax=Ornithinimicrobium cavernae TaxID=2666047 RepID=UPI000D697B33|nr:AEC family transporter [Ornithinimicrobium cavernae]
MELVVTAIVPIVLLLALGWTLRHRLLTDAGFWQGLEWTSYYVFMPALFISSITGADLSAVSPGPLLASLVAPVLAVATIVVVLRRPLHADGPALTSLVQGSIRFNTYLGLVLAAALHGREGIATFALAAALMVPLVNVLSVSLLAVHGDRGAHRPRLWRELAGNPLILSCVTALVLTALDIPLPGPLGTTVDLLAGPALVCGTLVAGAAITLRVDRRDVLHIVVTSLLKLVLLPLGAGALASTLGISGVMLASIVIITAIPTPPTAYVLASRMGGDTRLMASLTGAQTVVAMLSLPVIVPLATSL